MMWISSQGGQQPNQAPVELSESYGEQVKGEEYLPGSGREENLVMFPLLFMSPLPDIFKAETSL